MGHPGARWTARSFRPRPEVFYLRVTSRRLPRTGRYQYRWPITGISFSKLLGLLWWFYSLRIDCPSLLARL
jgi:hypothetical protein